jgi:hypothetical protein
MSTKVDTQAKLRVLEKYCAFVAKKGFHPTRPQLQKLGVTRDHIYRQFGSYENLQVEAREHSPKVFENIVDQTLFTRKAFQKLRTEAGKFRRYFVTTAVVGKKVHEGFWESIQTFCKRQNALLLVLPCADPASQGGWFLDPILKDASIVFSDLQINDNLFISSILLSAKHIDPITGLNRIGQRNGSFIYASPKQRLKMTPTSNTKIPHAMMTTGALTEAKYTTSRYLSERTAYIAENDHVLGGIIVEVTDDWTFHYRQVQADRNGHFVDLGQFYRGKKVELMRPEALVLGDWHSGETDPVAAAAFLFAPGSVAAVTRPKRIVIHDGFNGRSISHHEAKNRILRAQRAAANHLDLQTELEEYAKDLSSMSSLPGVEEVVIVCSNHDEFLHRYLKEGRYEEDPKNFLLGLKLSAAMVEGKSNPVRTAVEWIGVDAPSKLRWLSRDEDFKIANIELGAHGDKGANGARGSLQAMENAYGNSVSGHSHTPEILRGAWQVGTCSLLKLDYNTGPSSWLHSSCLVYPNGSRQMINVIKAQWRLVDNKS